MGTKKDDTSSTTYTLSLAALAALVVMTVSFFPNRAVRFPRNNNFNISLSPLPSVSNNISLPNVSAASAIIFDPASSVVLFERSADQKLTPASTTKMITAWVALSNFSPSDIVQVPEIDVEPQVMKLVAGERITIKDLLYGVLVWSANDAAEVVAAAFPGGKSAFVLEMNNVARNFGMNASSFKNPAGLPEQNHFSTARDLARFASIAMKKDEFARIVGTESVVVRSIDGRIAHKLVNLNELLGRVEGVLGVKTGWTEESKGSLVSYVDREDHPLVIVVLGSEDRFGDSEKLIEWAYTNHAWRLPLK